ncbi:hypothetical protein EGW08_000367 [Elysia chlorotica]|uniref:TGF-beta propeptide domain-containing protein n=1 Tax=Elysia chlorotica TaxID=188477 RepID=A0A433UDB8_ELYCH|nr:hypothetical protein EGW08_000367 [Elysia chlorotica]
MAVSVAVLAALFGILVGMGTVSCSVHIDHELAERTAHRSKSSSNRHDEDLFITDRSDGVDTDLYARAIQGETLAQQEIGEEEGDEESDDGDEAQKLMLRLRRPEEDNSEMSSFLRSYNSPPSSPSQFAAMSTSSRSLSPSSSLMSSSSSPSSSPSRQASSWLEPGSRISSVRLAHAIEARRRARARQGELRTQGFRRTILNGLGLEHAPSPAPSINPATRQALLNWLLQRQREDSAQPTHRPHVQRNCFLGQCTVPMGVNSSLWQDMAPHRLRLNFQLPRISRRGEQREEVESAELSLFVKPREGCPCLDDNGNQIPGYIVSVHQFTRRLVMRKRRVVHRTSLLDSVRVPYGGNAWLRLNVTRACRVWMMRPRRNLGLEIRVKDSNGTVVDARSVLGLPDCAATETERSCVDGSGPGIEILPWPYSWHERHVQALQGRPYLDLRVVDRSRTTVDLARSFGSTPRRLGSLEEFFASQ